MRDLGAPPDVRVEVVKRMMARIGVSLPPQEFVFEVANAFQQTHGRIRAEGTVENMLRRCTSYPVFFEALKQAGPAEAVLLYYCGDGCPGLPEAYILEEWRKAWPDTRRVETLAVSPKTLWDRTKWPRGSFDAVVSLSQLHFIYNLDTFFEMTDSCLKPGGRYAMAKEVNARYFVQPALQAELTRLRAENKRLRRWKDLVSPGRYAGFVKRKLGLGKPAGPSAFDRANDHMREKFGARVPLTPAEISRIVEIHRPTETLDGPQIGMNGFDVAHVAKNYLSGYSLEWSRTSNHMGFTHTDLLRPEWRKREVELGREFREDGAYISCVWRKR